MNTKKTNLKKQIIRIFLPVLLVLPSVLPARTINVIGVPQHGTAMEILQNLNVLDREIHQIFQLKKHKTQEKHLEVIFQKRQKPYLQVFRQTMRLELPVQANLKNDPEIFRAVVSALLLSIGCKNPAPDALEAVPWWICAGIKEKLHARKEAERLLRGLRSIPTVSGMYQANRMPDMTKFPALPYPAENEIKLWYEQFARVLLETAEEKKMLRNYVQELAGAANCRICSERFTKQVLETYQKSRSRTGDNLILNGILWNSYIPEPAERKLARWDVNMAWEMPEMDKDGKLTEKIQKCTIPELPVLLIKRPDAKEQLLLASQALQEYAVGCTREETILLHRLMLLLNNQSMDTDFVSLQVKNIVEQLKEKMEFRKKVEISLFRNEIRHIGVKEAFFYSLQVSPTGSSASPEQEKFLLRTEKIYGD